ncbi:MAG: sulfurtransferase complex subunit TusB [Nitrospinota bacterium]|nr:sulfurtransferase complex subunit TusB [Nitrospinota bacterium]
MLHLVNKSPFSNNALEEAARFASKGAPILLIEDGVLAARAGTTFEPKLARIIADHPVYALEPDLKARAVGKTAPGVQLVDYAGFVELVEKNKVHSWV